MLTDSHQAVWLLLSFAVLILFQLIAAQTIKADLMTDLTGNFLPAYSGPKSGELEVASAQVLTDRSNFMFTSTQAAPMGLTDGAFSAWGTDRGVGQPGFPVIAPGVLFDSIFKVDSADGSTVRDLVNNTRTLISNIHFSGSTINGTVWICQDSAFERQTWSPQPSLVGTESRVFRS